MAGFELSYGVMARGYDLADLENIPERSLVFDVHGEVIGKLHGENRLVVKLADVAPAFVEALLAREDNRFFSHGGVDWKGVVRAVVRNVKDKKATQGASTLTMQLARNSFGLGAEKTLHRKLMEVALTRRIEAHRSKEEILELYVNRIYFGNSLYGIERAAEAYFGKHAKALDLGEAALLAGIIRGPNRFSPFRNAKGAQAQRDAVLDRMVATGRLDPADAAVAKARPMRIRPQRRTLRQETYALDAVRRDLDVVLDQEEIEDGGLRIFTTIEPALQEAAQASVEARLAAVERTPGYRHQTREDYSKATAAGSEVPPEYLQGAVMVIENRTGAIRAVVGGRDFSQSAYNRALLAKRQVGSTFKPFVYAAGIEFAGLLPECLVSDAALEPADIRSAEGFFSPRNSDGTFTGMQPVEFGLIKSRNTMAVRVGERAGIDHVLQLADTAGIKEIPSRSPQVYLGNLGATLKSMTSAFSLFPNEGRRCRPYVIDRIEDAHGGILFRSGTMEYEVVSPGTAWLVTGMLEKVVRPGGTAAAVHHLGLHSPTAGKTGTTDDYHDAWFIGSTPKLTCGVWVGLDDPERIVGQGYGGRLAVPIWGDVMKQAEVSGSSGGAFPKPALTGVAICRISGLLATDRCGNTVRVDLPEDRAPAAACSLHSPGRNAPPGAEENPDKPTLWERFLRLFE